MFRCLGQLFVSTHQWRVQASNWTCGYHSAGKHLKSSWFSMSVSPHPSRTRNPTDRTSSDTKHELREN